VKKTSTARMQPVKIALAEGQLSILDGGLAPGQQIVVDGADRLRPGALVNASAARQRSGQGGGQAQPGQAAGPGAGGPFGAAGGTAHPAMPAGSGAQGERTGKPNDKRNKQ